MGSDESSGVDTASVRQWRDAVELQLARITDYESDDDWYVDIDLLVIAVYLLVRSCQHLGHPISESLQLVDRVRHEIEHPEDRDASHVYIEGEGTLSLWTWGHGHHGKGEATGAVVEVIDEAKAALAHADMVLNTLPAEAGNTNVDMFADSGRPSAEALADAAAHAIERSWQGDAD